MPTLSIVIPSRSQDDPGLGRLLYDLTQQSFRDYEVLIETTGNSEEAKAHGILRATGRILGFFCTDNAIRDRHFLKTMVWYASHPDVDGAYTAQYDYVKTDRILSRYCALLGANDPVCWWLGKADRHSYLERSQTEIRSFPRQIPSVGDNGFFLKRSVAHMVKIEPSTHFCIDFCDDLRRAGHARYWVVSSQKLWHRTGESWVDYFRRRYVYARDLYFRDFQKRRWIMVDTPRDWFAVLGFVLASLVVVPHLYTSVRGYRRVPDVAWLVHPVVCLGLTAVYAWAWMRFGLLSSFRRWIVHRNWRIVSTV